MEFPGSRHRRPLVTVPVPPVRPRSSAGSSSTLGGSKRRLSYNTSTTHHNPPSSFYSHPTSALQRLDENVEVFVPESPVRTRDQDTCWQPGQRLPCTPPFVPQHHPEHVSYNQTSPPSPAGDLNTVLQSMQSSIESGFQDLKGRLTQLEDRMERMEDKQQRFELQSASPASSNEGSSSSNEKGRRRRSPPELQYEIRRVHSSLKEEHQLKSEERIDSVHNKAVVKKIVQEVMGGTTNFTQRQIENGAKIHRKSLRDCMKPKSDSVQHKMRVRSRQEQAFERRTKFVKAKEGKSWKQVTADMMSEEEEDGDDFVRHRPTWRSARMNRFIDKLEHRYKTKHGKTLAKPRRYGSPVRKTAPPGIPSWMLATTTETPPSASGGEEFACPSGSDDLFSDGDSPQED